MSSFVVILLKGQPLATKAAPEYESREPFSLQKPRIVFINTLYVGLKLPGIVANRSITEDSWQHQPLTNS
jgi:hypothetical protein